MIAAAGALALVSVLAPAVPGPCAYDWRPARLVAAVTAILAAVTAILSGLRADLLLRRVRARRRANAAAYRADLALAYATLADAGRETRHLRSRLEAVIAVARDGLEYRP